MTPDKADVWRGTLALMVLKSLEAIGPRATHILAQFLALQKP
ncbi:MAG: hypothetical protein ACRD1V_07960 [Vicinamibacterales bacterium]